LGSRLYESGEKRGGPQPAAFVLTSFFYRGGCLGLASAHLEVVLDS